MNWNLKNEWKMKKQIVMFSWKNQLKICNQVHLLKSLFSFYTFPCSFLTLLLAWRVSILWEKRSKLYFLFHPETQPFANLLNRLQILTVEKLSCSKFRWKMRELKSYKKKWNEGEREKLTKRSGENFVSPSFSYFHQIISTFVTIFQFICFPRNNFMVYFNKRFLKCNEKMKKKSKLFPFPVQLIVSHLNISFCFYSFVDYSLELNWIWWRIKLFWLILFPPNLSLYWKWTSMHSEHWQVTMFGFDYFSIYFHQQSQ